MRPILLSSLAILMLTVAVGRPFPAPAANEQTPANGYWFFYVFETTVHPEDVEVSNDSPEEKRIYVSNVVLLPDDVSVTGIDRKVIPYFNDNVVEPVKKHHFDIDFYGQDARLNGGATTPISSKEEAEALRKKDIEQRKDRGGNIYSFNIVFGPAKGEPTSQPQLIYRDKTQPNYEVPKPKGKR